MNYASMSRDALLEEQKALLSAYAAAKAKGLSLDLSRGKPAADQLDLAMPMLDMKVTRTEKGFDARNYGILEGLPEMRALFSAITGIPAKNIIVGGNSSLNMMYDTMARAMLYGVADSPRPWVREERVVFLCPVPGYDRHFRICESLGIEMINIPMDENGPDMDEVERLVADPAVKGMWCVPKYSNPSGITYSEEVVRRLATMKTAAPDFRIFWDNAYIIHDLYDEPDQLADIFALAAEAGNANRPFIFTSTSKVTLPGAGVAMMAASDENLAQILPILGAQTIGSDKLNQLRHVAYLKDAENTREVMRRQADLIRPKFEKMMEILDRDLTPYGISSFTKPRGGYFISLDLEDGCAKRTFALCREAGVTLTDAGATYPYNRDPADKNLRLAPTFATLAAIESATEVLAIAARLATLEKLLA